MQPNTTYYFASGAHTLGSNTYSEIIPADGDTFIGAPGAVLDGRDESNYAFTQQASDVTIEYLTIERFAAPENEAVVNGGSAPGWILKYDTISNNPYGVGAILGPNNVLEYSCLTRNGESGFDAYAPNGDFNVTVSSNEISYNNTRGYDMPFSNPCGCAAGGKFWSTIGATVTGNYVHNNQAKGLWGDTDDVGFNIADNYFSHNWGEALMYEISYNARIVGNVFVGNGVGKGKLAGAGFPTTAIYLSESGSDQRVASPYNSTFLVASNVFINNWGGVIIWESADRFCGDNLVFNGFDKGCTLVQPGLFTSTACAAKLESKSISPSSPYYENCRWRAQNIEVTHNVFSFSPSKVGSSCTPSDGCGYNGLFSLVGTVRPYRGTGVAQRLTFDQNNHFSNNTYSGPWSFMANIQGHSVDWGTWQAPQAQGGYGQDAGSSLSS